MDSSEAEIREKIRTVAIMAAIMQAGQMASPDVHEISTNGRLVKDALSLYSETLVQVTEREIKKGETK